ncbi:peptidoglycan-recognition protein LF-like isoform X2 [Macrosteles quadrilineatus]|uniref:peptidoglycan-recognition protein LF-like isoform X2 n=1 Tax=Macrosteles quadrilineatus TaxID=74068 RepID=UPI0023E28CDE|nr:peptidoglycan-recognition protein LF-like isoform X2 [Macrosteles quadrilineatus]
MARKDGQYAQFIPRQMWKADPEFPKGMTPLKTPVENVVAAWTNTPPCSSPQECMTAVRMIQKKHVESGLPDIAHNFLIGGDGRIYEGRGWRHQGPVYPETVEDHERLNNNCVEIAFIDWASQDPTPKQMMCLSPIVLTGQELLRIVGAFNFYWNRDGFVKRVTSYNPFGK